MKTLTLYNKILFVLLGIFLAGIVWALLSQPTQVAGSVITGGEYIATTTRGLSTGHQVVRGSLTTLGSVIVASSSASTFEIWNATSTTDAASTTLTVLKAGISEGTYVFDIDLFRGLVVNEPGGFNGDYVVTYRAQ